MPGGAKPRLGRLMRAVVSLVLCHYENRSLLFCWSRGDRRLNGALAKFFSIAPVLLDSLWDGWDAASVCATHGD